MSNAAVAFRQRGLAATGAQPQTLVVEPATPIIGAELSGVDRRRPLDPRTLEAVEAAQVRFPWRPNSLVVWDNAAVSRARPIDYAPFSLGRTVRRSTVAGDLPQGPDGFRSQPLEGQRFDVLG
jgi:alpha-ketoglutarate-dependent taurine dioxygenase